MVEEVATRADLDAFLRFPQQLYAHDPAWVPPLLPLVRRRIRAARANLRLFIARHDGEIVGTISALRDPKHEEVQEEQVAFFGFFECIDDAEVAAALFDRAAEAARGWGATLLRGPRNLSRVEEVGFTVEGHQIPPPFLAGHHPARYAQLAESNGFVKHHDSLAYDVALYTEDRQPAPMPEHLAAKSAAVDLPGLEIRGTRWSSMSRDLTTAHEVFVDAFRAVPENTPMSRGQFLAVGFGYLLFTPTELLQLATVDGRSAGFALCFPDFNEVLQRSGGGLGLGALAKMVTAPKVKTVSFKLFGVMPEFRGSGLHAALITAVIEGVRKGGYERLEASLIDERNGPSRGVVEGAGMKVYRRYRTFERSV